MILANRALLHNWKAVYISTDVGHAHAVDSLRARCINNEQIMVSTILYNPIGYTPIHF